MRLPKNILSGNYIKPRIFLCETDKSRICKLETTNTKGTFKFNSYSELSFEVARVYNDTLSGETKVNPFYDKIEALRLIELEDFGYFEIQGPEMVGDGIKETKDIKAYSYEYTLAQKYIEDFKINMGTIDSLEVLNAEEENKIVPITLYNPQRPELSLLHLAMEKAYGWKIQHVDSSLATLSRQFEIDRQSIYDFLMTEVCEKFNCYIVFDTINSTISVYAESLTSKFIGDGVTNEFTISPPFAQIGTVSVDGYKTTRWDYEPLTGKIILDDVPENGAHIEVIDGALTKWETDVFVTFQNLAQEVNVNYDADAIKTVLTVTYGEDLNIRETNMGLPYLTDLSYYYTVDWMGQELYDAYTAYMQKSNSCQSTYTQNTQQMLDIANRIDFDEHRLSLEYSIAQSVNETTVGTYYVRGGEAPNYYYTEVSLPADWKAGTTYYSTATTNLNEDKVSNLYEVLKQYFNNDNEWEENIDKLSDDFQFMEVNTLNDLKADLKKITANRTKNEYVEAEIGKFLDEMWEQIGRTPLKSLYYETYKTVQTTNMSMEPDEDGKNGGNWSEPKHPNYPFYYPVVLYLNSIEKAISKRDKSINNYQVQYNQIQQENVAISGDLELGVFFVNYYKQQGYADNDAQDRATQLLVRLNAFFREDELHIDDIVETSQTTIAESFTLKQDAMETGRIELQKRSQPQLQFSMSMANIYALPEFEPIVDQFQLGNVIKVGLRSDYIKQSRLLQVDIGFDDFSDFSCEFGELTSLRSQSDIHADLLKKAVQAGKSVATNASYWTKGSDQANSIDLRLEEGLLNSIEALKAIDGTQNAYMDKYGIHLEAVNPDTGEVSDKRVWLVNNQIVFTDDGFKTGKAVLGEFTVDDVTYYGLLAQAVISGYIEGSQIKGGTIQIGLQDDGTYAFEVHEDGSVTMNGGSSIDGYAKEDDVKDIQNKVQEIQTAVDTINNSKMYRVEIQCSGAMIMNMKNQTATLSCKVYSWDTDITDTLDASLFNWVRVSNNSDQDEIWNNNTIHQGRKTLTITTEDITNNANFYCEVSLPE